MTRFPSLVAALAAASFGAGASPFDRVGGEGGPLPEAVTALLQDRAGFVWIGSREGLLRYDGFSFQSFRHDPKDAGSLPDNAIRTLFEDREDALWVGTNTGGLARLDRHSWTFERFRHDSADPGSLSYDSVYAIEEDRAGDLWIGTQRGLNRLDRRTGRMERFLSGTPGLQDDYITALAVDGNGNVWVGTVRGGLTLLDRAAGRFRAFRHDPSDPKSLPSDAVFALARDPSGRLWIGTERGVARLAPDGAFERVGLELTAGRARPTITSLAISADAVWAGTLGLGVWRLDPGTGAARALRQSREERHDAGTGRARALRQSRAQPRQASDQIIAVLVDRAGTLWAGTWGAGLYRVSPAAVFLESAAAAIARPHAVPDEAATAVSPARSGGAWVGTWSGELVRVDRDRTTRAIARFPEQTLLAIADTAEGKLWIGTNVELLRLDLASGKTTAFRHDASDPSSIGPGWVVAVRQDAKGRLWIGTGEGGLQRLAPSGQVAQRFRQDPADPSSLSDDYVTAIVPDTSGTLWIGTRSGGLNAFDPETGRAVRYRPEVGRVGTIGHHHVTSILEDSRARLWVGTAGGGFARVDSEGGSKRFERFTAADGLVDDDVMAIVEDAASTLWISTKRGISRFDPTTRAFVTYLASDGLPSAEFERGAGARMDGLIVLGSLRWAVGVPADSPFTPAPPSPTTITSIRTAAGERRGAPPDSSRSPVEIRRGDWLSVELAVLDFASAGAHAYAYRLGEEARWIDLGGRRDITFAGLAAGTYDLYARGRDVRGAWSQAPPLAIRVIPPFWATSWFRALLAIAAVAAGIAVHRVRASALERRNRELVAIDKERERSRAALAAAYDRLGFLTRRLEAAKEEERGHIARELHDELGPNLTAVIINLKLLGNLPDPESSRRRLADSTELVDRMVQRIRDISLDLRPPLLEEMGLAAALRGYLEAQAERTGLCIEMNAANAVPHLSPEVAITAFRVTQEAVTNAIRHAAARSVRVDLDRSPAGLEIKVEDDGNGFDVRATMAGAVSKALGLLGMQERVRLLGGEVRIASEPGTGTRVHVSLPFEVAS